MQSLPLKMQKAQFVSVVSLEFIPEGDSLAKALNVFLYYLFYLHGYSKLQINLELLLWDLTRFWH